MNTRYTVIESGKTNYYIKTNRDSELDFSAKELQLLLEESTGVAIDIEKTESEDKNFISLEETTDTLLYPELDKLNSQGYLVKVKDGNIHIVSKSTEGVSNGVYGFLEKILNFDCFYDKVYHIDKVDRLVVEEMTYSSNPDIEFRVASYGYQKLNEDTKRRMRLMNYEEIFANTTMGQYHNIFGYISPEEFYETHPEWFNDDKTQLCYTAHGDDQSLNKMIETVATKMFNYFRQSLSSEIIIALNDLETRCNCDKCNSEKEKYGADSGAFIKFLNKVAIVLKQKFIDVGDSRANTFHIVFYAYFYLEDAPVKIKKYPNGNLFYDGNGDVVFFYDSEIVLNEHVSPMICQFWLDYHKSYYSPSNFKYIEIIKKWGAISKNIHLWTYDQYFCNGGYMLPYNSFKHVQDMYRMAKSHNIAWLYPEGQVYNKNSTGFVAYRGYLQSKLAWNVDEDVCKLKSKFFEKMYGSKKIEMIALFDDVTAHLDHLGNDYGVTGWCHNHTLYELGYWPKATVKGWIDRAIEIEKELLRQEDYSSAKNVRLETISFLYIFLRIYKNSLVEEEKERYISLIKQYIDEFSIIMRCQEMQMSVYLDKIDTIANV